MPKLTTLEWELLFGDIRCQEQELEDDLNDLWATAENAKEEVDAIADYAPYCSDCNRDTNVIDEYYMVKDELWEQATATQQADKLCIGCLEKRIGRQLTKHDFNDAPVNELSYGTKSDRLRNRLTAEAYHDTAAD